jgi:hypothetical protein
VATSIRSTADTVGCRRRTALLAALVSFRDTVVRVVRVVREPRAMIRELPRSLSVRAVDGATRSVALTRHAREHLTFTRMPLRSSAL